MHLPYKPLSAHLGKGVAELSVSLRNVPTDSLCMGHIWISLSKTTLAAGELLVLPLALIESVAGAAIAAVGFAFNKLFIKSPLVEREVLQIASYALHSSFVFLTALSALVWDGQPNLRYHTQYALIDHALHLVSASLIQQAAGFRNRQEANQKILALFKTHYPHLIQEIGVLIEKDTKNPVQIDQRVSLDSYLEKHPEHLPLIENLDLWKALIDREYSLQLKQFAKEFLIEIQLVRRSPEKNQLSLELNQLTEEERAYQDRLIKATRLAFFRVNQNAKKLDLLIKTGKERLASLDRGVFPPLARQTQLAEIEFNETDCPSPFTAPSCLSCNPRKEELSRLKQQINSMREPQKKALFTKLFYPEKKNITFRQLSEIEAQDLDPIRESIQELANDFYRGPLLKRAVIRLDEPGPFFDVENLFEKTCLEESRN